MSNLTIYPSSGGIIVTLDRSGTIAKGDYVKMSANGTVAAANGAAIVGVALDAGTEGIGEDKISVLLFAHTVITVTEAIGGSPTFGDYLKPHTDGTLTKDGAVKTANSVAFVIDSAKKTIAII